MKITDKEKLRDLSPEDLVKQAEEFRQRLFELRLQSTTSPVKDNQQFKKLRRNVARVLTVLNEKLSNIANDASSAKGNV